MLPSQIQTAESGSRKWKAVYRPNAVLMCVTYKTTEFLKIPKHFC